MNTKKIIGLVLWLIAFAIPFQPALLNTQDVSNTLGLISFVAMLALVFIGYALVDSAGVKAGHEGHGH